MTGDLEYNLVLPLWFCVCVCVCVCVSPPKNGTVVMISAYANREPVKFRLVS